MTQQPALLSTRLGVEDLKGQLAGKRVLMRVDYNVPMNNCTVTDSTRIRATVPTIQYLLAQKPKCIVLLSHCGRPDGRIQPEHSLKPCAPILQDYLEREVRFVNDCVGPQVTRAVNEASEGLVILLENLRFHVEEEGKGVAADGSKIKATEDQVKLFCEALTRLGDVYVNDAFGTAHRAHASVVGVNLSLRAAGLLMKKELSFFGKALEDPPRPFLAILGGAKVKDKILLIENLLNSVDLMIIGGGMAYTFLKIVHGMDIGDSLYDEEGAARVPAIMAKAEERKVKILLPIDFVVADSFSETAKTKVVQRDEGIQSPWQGLDCGPRSVEAAKELIMSAKLIVWNGPQGRFEWPSFAQGSLGFLDAVARATSAGALSIVGGGDTASLVENARQASKMSHVSTGGGASLELLEGKILPGVSALSSK